MPGEADEDAGPQPQVADGLRYLRPGLGRGAARAAARLRRRPQQLAVQRRAAVGRARGVRARPARPRRVGQGGPRSRWARCGSSSTARGSSARTSPAIRWARWWRASSLAAEPDRVLSLTLIAPAGLGPEIDREYIDGFVAATRASSSSRCSQRLFADPTWSTARWSTTCSSTSDWTACRRRWRRCATVCSRRRAGENARPRSLCRPDAGDLGRAPTRSSRPGHAEAAPSRAEVTVLDGVGHSPHMEAAGEVNRQLEGFLAGVRAG